MDGTGRMGFDPSSSTTGNGQGRYPERRDGAARPGRSRLHSHGSGHRLVGIGLVLPSARFQQLIDSRSQFGLSMCRLSQTTAKEAPSPPRILAILHVSALYGENTTHLCRTG